MTARRKRAPRPTTAAAATALLDVAYHFGRKFLVLAGVFALMATAAGWVNSRFIARPILASADSLNANIRAVGVALAEESKARRAGDSLLSAQMVEQIQAARVDGYTKGQIDNMRTSSETDRAELRKRVEVLERQRVGPVRPGSGRSR